MGDPAEPPPIGRRLQEIAGSVSSFVAPITLVSAVLFYFGYVFTTTEYEAFGLDVTTVGLSTQEFIIRSPSALLFPLLAASLGGAVLAYAHTALARRITASRTEAPWRLGRYRRVARGVTATGAALLVAGAAMVVGMIAVRPLLTDYYDIVVSTGLATGTALCLYGLRLDRMLDGPRRGAAVVALFALLATSLLWTTATVAQYTGRYVALQLVRDRPGVLLDTKERLYLPTTTVRERVLPPAEGQTFHYRYENLRLLIQGKDAMFLVPNPWRPGEPTLVVPMSGDVRLQFLR